MHIRILSIREAKNLDEGNLQTALRYVCRPDRPDPQNNPKLKGLYVFGASETTLVKEEHEHQKSLDRVRNLFNQIGKTIPTDGKNIGPVGLAADAWYWRKGKLIKRPISSDWAATLKVCAGLIAFDAPLCTGPRHISSPVYGLNPHLRPSSHASAVATVALSGCASCGQAPEGLTYHNAPTGKQLPVLGPVPVFSSTLKAAQRPDRAETLGKSAFVARCVECLHNRYCTSCHKWWCETCYLDGKHTYVEEPVIVDMLEEDGVSSDEFLEPPGLAQQQQVCKFCSSYERIKLIGNTFGHVCRTFVVGSESNQKGLYIVNFAILPFASFSELLGGIDSVALNEEDLQSVHRKLSYKIVCIGRIVSILTRIILTRT